MNIIAAVDENWGIGYENKLLISIPADMRFFRDETMGKVIVMGRKTFEGLPSKQALINRRNIVLTGNRDYKAKDVEIAHDLNEVLELIQDVPDMDIYMIGGESVYRQMLPHCSVAHITKIHYAYQADAYFPNLDKDDDWYVEYASEEQTYYNVEYEFYKYVRK
jgi:dihydrofolate reductase